VCAADGFYADHAALFDSILFVVASLKLHYIRLCYKRNMFFAHSIRQLWRIVGKLVTVSVSMSCGVLVLPVLYIRVTVQQVPREADKCCALFQEECGMFHFPIVHMWLVAL